jgi:hypothetical protein
VRARLESVARAMKSVDEVLEPWPMLESDRRRRRVLPTLPSADSWTMESGDVLGLTVPVVSNRSERASKRVGRRRATKRSVAPVHRPMS